MEKTTYRRQEAYARHLAQMEPANRAEILANTRQPLRDTLRSRIAQRLAEKVERLEPMVANLYLARLPAAERLAVEHEIDWIKIRRRQLAYQQQQQQRQAELPQQPGLIGMFDPETYWAGKPFKTFVITITNDRGATDIFYRASATAAGAIASAKHDCRLNGRIRTNARLATPADLAAVETGSGELSWI